MQAAVKYSLGLLLPILILPILFSERVQALEFELEGVITYSAFPSKRPPVRIEKQFHVVTKGCDSKIRVRNPGAEDYVEAGFERGLIFTLSAYFHNEKEGETNRRSGTVEFRDEPRDEATSMNYLWLAYSSACYLDKQTTNQLRPIWVLDDPALAEQDFRLPAIWLRSGMGTLPDYVVYLGDGYWHTRNSQGGGRLRITMPAPYDSHFTNAEFRVVQSTNWSGQVIPLAFIFKRYAVRPRPGTNAELVVLAMAEASVHSLRRPAVDVKLKPGFEGTFYVADTRFSKSNPPVPSLTYMVTNGVWPEVADLVASYRKEVRDREMMASSSPAGANKTPSKKIIVYLVFILVAIIPIFALIFRNRRLA